MAGEPKELIESKAKDVAALEHKVADKIAELKAMQQDIDGQWKTVESLMIEHDVKSIKGDWGSLTIAERINWDYDPTMLAPKFFKKVVDTKKLTDTFRLEGKQPKGATAKYIKYLMKRLK